MAGLPRQTLILASASPRRLDLLAQIGLVPAAVDPPAVDERPQPRELPRDHAVRLAREKGETVAPRHPGAVILAADTVVACGRRILPKAECLAEAEHCLALLSGRRHRVYGAVFVHGADGRCGARLVRTDVAFKVLGRDEMAAYLGAGEWQGKAGGYAIQGRAAAFVRWIGGSYSNVVGLPLFETASLLRGFGIEPATAGAAEPP